MVMEETMTRETIIDALINAAEEVLGLSPDDMRENTELDLFENELIDSIGCIALLTEVESIIGKSIDVSQMVPNDFTSLSTMADAIEKITK